VGRLWVTHYPSASAVSLLRAYPAAREAARRLLIMWVHEEPTQPYIILYFGPCSFLLCSSSPSMGWQPTIAAAMFLLLLLPLADLLLVAMAAAPPPWPLQTPAAALTSGPLTDLLLPQPWPLPPSLALLP